MIQQENKHEGGLAKKQMDNVVTYSCSEESSFRTQELWRDERSAVLRKRKVYLESRKEIKHYFDCINRGKAASAGQRAENCMRSLLKYFRKSQKKVYFQNTPSSLVEAPSKFTQKQRLTDYLTIQKSLPRASLLLLILNCRDMDKDIEQGLFDLELLSLQGKIIYKNIMKRNWATIFLDIQTLRANNAPLVCFIANREGLLAQLERNEDLLLRLEDFHDLETVRVEDVCASFERNEQLRGLVSSVGRVYRVIRKYVFIISQFIGQANQEGRGRLEVEQMQALALAYNLTVDLVYSQDIDLHDQIRAYEGKITRNIENQQRSRRTKRGTDSTKEDHYPSCLRNAQICWKCKAKRSYISCLTCNRTETKETSFCLNCFGPHHQEQDAQLHPSKLQATLSQWNSVNAQIQSMLPPMQPASQLKQQI